LVFGAVVGASLGAVFTYFIRKRLHQQEVERTGREEVRRREQQRRLLVSLLGDEIVLRWNQIIAKYLRQVFKEYSLDNVHGLCTMRFQPQDLFVFQQCANDVALTTVFDDNAVVSHIIYVHILAKDLCDKQNLLGQKYKEYKSAETSDTSADKTNDRSVKAEWEDMKHTFDQMDTEMIKMFTRIENEYNKYIETSDFIQELQVNVSEVRRKLERAAEKRLPRGQS